MLTQEPQLYIFDFDGCLYPYPDNLFELMIGAYGRAGHIISKGRISLERAGDISHTSYQETGLGYKAICEQFNISLAEGFFHHHQHMHFDLTPDRDLIDALRTLDRDQTHLMILTHSAPEFLDRKLKMLELDEFFPRNMRVTHDDYNFQLKSESFEGYVQALVRAHAVTGIEFQPKHATMFEDTPKNLKPAKAMGMQTALITHNNALQVKPGEDLRHIDNCIKTATEMLRQRPRTQMTEHRSKSTPVAYRSNFSAGFLKTPSSHHSLD